MPYAIYLVVRKSKSHGTHYCGPASSLPLSLYHHVRGFGEWYGSQMNWQPYKDAVDAGWNLAIQLDKGEKL